jgi:transposase
MKEKKKAPRRKYDADFKQQVLQMIANGRPVREVAEWLGIGENLIYRWRSRPEAKGAVGKENDFSVSDQQALLKRIRELEMERDMDPMLTHVC